ncbi:MAG: ATP-binding protein [Halobacteriovoraceae bacterium]|nr:ATP-binding protein [Halobacteriovoraceae bacterium]
MNFFKRYTFVDVYFLFSLASSALLWTSFFIINNYEYHEQFYTTSLLGLNFFFFHHYFGQSFLLRGTRGTTILALGQTICYFGLFFQFKDTTYILLGLLPSIFLPQLLQNTLGSFWSWFHEKSHYYMGIVLLIFATFYSLNRTIIFEPYSVITIVCIIIWAFGTTYLGGACIEAQTLRHLSKVLRGKGTLRTMSSHRERLFFHDLINHTHSMGLFLQNRISMRMGLDTNESESVYNEIKMLESLVRDHFQYSHKNLIGLYEYVTFEFAKKTLFNLVANFLPPHQIQTKFIFEGHISDSVPILERNQYKVYFPYFYRILTNLLKNIAEQGSKQVEMKFDYRDDVLRITIKNNITDLAGQNKNLDLKLQQTIQKISGEGVKYSTGLGLESVHELCQELGGEFKFFIEDSCWHSLIILPNPEVKNLVA